MSKIRILPEDVSNRIAAGEVIERPASVIKELAENSLDAGATQITINVSRGGRSSIKVIDNGCGMDSEDSLLSIEAHATSKIKSAQDVESIASFGFRGEALPSIASVSRFELRTKTPDKTIGTEVLVNGGIIKSVSEIGCASGTSITVKNIFYNIPARKKFLRTVNTEEFHITEIVLLMALANPGVGFQLSFDKRPVISVQAESNLRTRATMLLGKDTVSAMLPINYSENDIHVSGFVARPGLSRASRKDQRTFVNGRPINSNTIYYAIKDAYHTLVMKGRFPPVLLFVKIDPTLIDVNVHPAKKEIRFRDGHSVGSVIKNGIDQTLKNIVEGFKPSPGPTITSNHVNTEIKAESELSDNGVTTENSQSPLVDTASSEKRENLSRQETAGDSGMYPIPKPPIPPPDSSVDLTTHQSTIDDGTSVSAVCNNNLLELRILGAIGNLFILAEGRHGLVLIDQHAAHERIMFEKVLKQMKLKDGIRQGLLMPITVDFSNADTKIIAENLSHLSKLGFEIEDFGNNTFIISAIPAHFPQDNISGMLMDIVDQLRNSPASPKRPDEAKIAKIACKAAVKAHDHLTDKEMSNLLKELNAMELPFTCPHGRPTMINLSFKELEKRFGRRQ